MLGHERPVGNKIKPVEVLGVRYLGCGIVVGDGTICQVVVLDVHDTVAVEVHIAIWISVLVEGFALMNPEVLLFHEGLPVHQFRVIRLLGLESI